MPDVYSLWLVPDPGSDAYRRLEVLIGDLATARGDAPEFEPHVTVLGGLSNPRDDVLKAAETLVRTRQPLDLTFTAVQCSTTTHQCVFVLVEPTVELLSLRRTAVRRSGASGGMYVPHLSLVYSDMSVEDRIETAESIDSDSVPVGARANTLSVVETTGSASEWAEVARYRL